MTNLHYRKFFEDELENDDELFPEMPFVNYSIIRGQARGASGGGILGMFSKPKKDADG